MSPTRGRATQMCEEQTHAPDNRRLSHRPDTRRLRRTGDQGGRLVTAPGGDLSFDTVAAALRADSADVALYTRVLTESLGDTLPPGCVSVERSRSMSDRMRGRPGDVSRITVRLGERVLSIAAPPGRPPSAEICHEVRGVVLSRQPVGLGEWAGELARALLEHAEQNAEAARALRRLVAEG